MGKSKMISPTWLEGEPRVGFRIHSNGEVEVLTEAETVAMVLRTIYEGMQRAGWRRLRLEEIPPLPLTLIEIGRLSPIIDCARAVHSVER